MKLLTALVLVILLNCFYAEEDFAFRLKSLEQVFATRLQKDDLRIRNLEETVKQQQTVLYDQWKTIQQLNDRLETQNNIIKRLSDGRNPLQDDTDSKSMGTSDEMRDLELPKTVGKDSLFELNKTIKGASFFMNQEQIRKHSTEKDGDNNSKSEANWTSTKDDRTDVHTSLVTEANNREPHKVGRKHSRAIANPVAFTAVKWQHQTGIGLNQNILFDRLTLNDGGGFNIHHGVFTAPVTGYYLFSTSILHPPQQESLHAGLMHNGLLIALAHGSTGIYDQGTQTVVLKVRAGEQVWVGNRDYTDEIVFGNGYSSFSGYLLYQL